MAEVAGTPDSDRKPLIVEDEGVVGGAPRLSGTRIRVSDVFLRYKAGEAPEEIAEVFDLDLEKVHAALSYYFGNKEKIRQELEEREKEIEKARERHESRM